MENRLSTLEGPAKHQVADIKDDLDKMRGRLRTLEGRKTIKERLGDLDSRIHYLEHGSPSLDSSLIK